MFYKRNPPIFYEIETIVQPAKQEQKKEEKIDTSQKSENITKILKIKKNAKESLVYWKMQ